MYTLYILLCKDNTLYTGITNDLERRFKEHKEGKASKYTRARKVKKIVYTEKLKNKSLALKREIEIKKLNRKQKDALIKNK